MKKEQIGNATLYLGDCMELMASLPDKSIDLAIVDPPYGIGMDGKFGSGGKNVSGLGKKNPDWIAKQWKAFNDIAPSVEYFNELFRVSKDQIIWGANNFISRMPIDSVCWIVWDKCKPEGISFSDCELAWTSFNTKISKFTFLWNGCFQGKSELGKGHIFCGPRYIEKRIHPTQKPVALYKWLLSRYAKRGDKILDTHLGSGSIAVACNELGFDLTASEIDEDYFNAACKRIKEESKQGDLFRGAA